MVKGGARYLLATSLFALAPSAEASETIVYSYDSLGRLIGVERSGTANPGTSAAYSYDLADNRTNVTVSVAVPLQSQANIPLDLVAIDSDALTTCTPASDDVATSDGDGDGVCSEAPPAPDEPAPGEEPE